MRSPSVFRTPVLETISSRSLIDKVVFFLLSASDPPFFSFVFGGTGMDTGIPRNLLNGTECMKIKILTKSHTCSLVSHVFCFTGETGNLPYGTYPKHQNITCPTRVGSEECQTLTG